MTRVEVGLLGPFEVRRDGHRVSLGSRRTEALFAYLVTTGQAHSREHLVDLLWHDEQGATAPGNLRVLFTNLRKSVGDLVQITRNSAVFAPGSTTCVVDLRQHEARVNGHLQRPVEDLGPEDLDEMRRAAEQIGGDFLENLELPGPTRFDDWVRTTRDRERRNRQVLLGHLCRGELAHGDVPDALRHARQLVDLDPLAESGHQLLIRALTEAGDVDGAMAQFETLERLLRDEFGTTPSGVSRALLVRRPPSRPAHAADHQAPRSSSVRAPWASFVDREEELAALLQAGREAVQGRGGVTVVRGSMGCGKSLLARRTVRLQLQEQPALVALGGGCAGVAVDTQGDLFLGTLHAQLEGQTDAPWLEGPMPAVVADRISALSPSPRRPDRPFAATALAADLREVARERPVLLVVENVQWAGAGTLALLASLAADIRSRSIHLLCTLRPGPTRRPTETSTTSRHGPEWLLARLRAAARARLLDLDASGAQQLSFVTSLIDSEPHDLPASIAEDVAALSAGNPLVAVELLRDLVRRRAIRREAGRFLLEGTPSWPAVPERVALAFEEQLTEITPTVRVLLRAAACLGVEFGVAELAEETGLSRWAVRASLAEGPALHQWLLQPLPGDRFRFRQVLLREYLVETTAGARVPTPRASPVP